MFFTRSFDKKYVFLANFPGKLNFSCDLLIKIEFFYDVLLKLSYLTIFWQKSSFSSDLLTEIEFLSWCFVGNRVSLLIFWKKKSVSLAIFWRSSHFPCVLLTKIPFFWQSFDTELHFSPDSMTEIALTFDLLTNIVFFSPVIFWQKMHFNAYFWQKLCFSWHLLAKITSFHTIFWRKSRFYCDPFWYICIVFKIKCSGFLICFFHKCQWIM